MKAPLRFAFGWVLYFAIFAAINPVVRVIWEVVQEQPVLVPIITAVIACAALAAIFLIVLRPFWSWCDHPRKTTREVPPCS